MPPPLHLSQVKRIISIALILLMSLQCFYELGILTYFQLNRDYIAEVLCINKDKPAKMCHGQCFLTKSLDLAIDEPSNESTTPPAIQKAEFPVFIVSELQYALHEETTSQVRNARYLATISSKHTPTPFHPPGLPA